MNEASLLILILIFIVLLIAIIHFYDKHLVKEINSYEERLEKKGIFKRHFIKNRKNQK